MSSTRAVWGDPSYLLRGTARQREAWHVLDALGVFTALREHGPVLAGTIPLDIDIAESDLDVICEVYDLAAYAQQVTIAFGRQDDFQMRLKPVGGMLSAVARFRFGGFPIEIFGQPRPVEEQNAFRHMAIEARLLEIGGEVARREIRRMKRAGFKTEPAFARYFKLEGDPYQALLRLAELDDGELRASAGEPAP